jgi:hypothetical protein
MLIRHRRARLNKLISYHPYNPSKHPITILPTLPQLTMKLFEAILLGSTILGALGGKIPDGCPHSSPILA